MIIIPNFRRVALEKAKDHGLLDLDPPFVEYDYDKYRSTTTGQKHWKF